MPAMIAFLIAAATFGPAVNDLRASLSVTDAGWLELTFENVSTKALYLPLGSIDSGRLEAVRLTISQDGNRNEPAFPTKRLA